MCLKVKADHYINPELVSQDGVMWPSSAELFLVPCSATRYYSEKVEFWEDVYGFDFSPMM